MLYLPGLPAFATEDQSNVGEINVLASRQTRRPQQTALTQSLTERAAGAVPRIGKDAAETRPLKHLKHETSANHQCAATTTPNLVNDDDDSAAHTGFALNARKVKKPMGASPNAPDRRDRQSCRFPRNPPPKAAIRRIS